VKDEIHKDIRNIVYSPECERAFIRIKSDKNLFSRVEHQLLKIIREPMLGKPLRYSLKNRRRVHVGSFVLVYEFHGGELRFLGFDHHDRIYKKHV
jgi:mRNA-degrading endonuclease RelE of RelBE toxin-antitoxin system